MTKVDNDDDDDADSKMYAGVLYIVQYSVGLSELHPVVATSCTGSGL